MPSLGSTAARASSAAAASASGSQREPTSARSAARQPQRPVGDRAGAEAGLGDDAALDPQRAGDGAHGVVAVARRDLGEARAPAGAAGREAHLGHDLVGLEAARQVRDEELLGGHEAGAGRPRDLDLAGQRLQHERQLGRGVGVRDRAADRAAVARRDVPDVGQGELQQRTRGERVGVALEVALRAERADAHRAVCDVDHGERRHLAEVDEHRRAPRAGS